MDKIGFGEYSCVILQERHGLAPFRSPTNDLRLDVNFDPSPRPPAFQNVTLIVRLQHWNKYCHLFLRRSMDIYSIVHREESLIFIISWVSFVTTSQA